MSDMPRWKTKNRSEYMREYSRKPEVKERRKKYNAREDVRKRKKNYNKEYHKKYYEKNRGKLLRKNKEYRIKNPKIHRKWDIKARTMWGRIKSKHDTKVIKESELFVAKEVLPKYGFYDIILTRDLWHTSFPVDILAKKDGRECAIEVTLCYGKKISTSQREFIKRFNLPLYICHVKPDFTFYYLKEIDMGTTHSCILGISQALKAKQNGIEV